MMSLSFTFGLRRVSSVECSPAVVLGEEVPALQKELNMHSRIHKPWRTRKTEVLPQIGGCRERGSAVSGGALYRCPWEPAPDLWENRKPILI